jgi:hypothetical protein
MSTMEISGFALRTGDLTFEHDSFEPRLMLPMALLLDPPWTEEVVRALLEAGVVKVVLTVDRPEATS